MNIVFSTLAQAEATEKPVQVSLARPAFVAEPPAVLIHGPEGIDPKSGRQMRKVRLVACEIPQDVWFDPETRTCMPCSN